MGNTPAICRYGIGLLAVISSLVFMYQGIGSFPIFFASLFLLIISTTDTFFTKVPNLVNLTLLLTGFGFHLLSEGPSGLFLSFTGCLAGFALLFPAYLFRVLGAGDVKALAALGALTGVTAIFQIFLYTSLIGGLIAVLYYLSKCNLSKTIIYGMNALHHFFFTRDFKFLKLTPSSIRFPYAAAIAFGYFAYIQWGNLI